MRIADRNLGPLLALCLAAPAAAGDLTPLGSGWERYANARFGTLADVPRGVFAMAEPPAESGDGRQFAGPGGARLAIYATHAPSTVTDGFKAYKAWILDQAEASGLTVTYRAEGRGWIVYSGLRGSTVVYERVVAACGAGHHLSLNYPASDRATFDPLVARMGQSLGCGSRGRGR